MVESEVLIAHLRRQVQDLETLVDYLESRQPVTTNTRVYSQAKLHALIIRLHELERFSRERGAAHHTRPAWWN